MQIVLKTLPVSLISIASAQAQVTVHYYPSHPAKDGSVPAACVDAGAVLQAEMTKFPVAGLITLLSYDDPIMCLTYSEFAPRPPSRVEAHVSVFDSGVSNFRLRPQCWPLTDGRRFLQPACRPN